MMLYGLWHNAKYVEATGTIMAGLVVLALITFFLRNRGAPYSSGWASLKSWLFVAPMVFLVLAIPNPWPIIFLSWMGVLASKSFFQMVGMYHRSWFVWCTYLFIFALGALIHYEELAYYNISPMIFLGVICLIPVLRNSASSMIQYTALSLMAFIFWGWAYMHIGRLLAFPEGPLITLYLYLLTEVSENVTWACSRLFGRFRPFDKISKKVTLEGMLVAFPVTMLLAWGCRHFMPDRAERYWIAAGLVATIFGRMGDLTINVIRRDLGIKNTGVFIIGREGFLSRVDKLIFVAPIFFYFYIYLQRFEIQ
jgi:phosphatidate cytidylyltransferase